MEDSDDKVCQLCNAEQQHLKACLDCGLVFCPCSEIVGVDIIVDVGDKCPNCSSTNLVVKDEKQDK